MSSLTAVALIIASMGLAPAGDAATTTMVVRGGTGPELGSTYRSFERPRVSDGAGIATVIFEAKLRSATVGTQRGIFTADTIAPDMSVALQGDAAPPTFVRAHRRFQHPSLNSSGISVYEGSATGGDNGIYRSGDVAVAVLGDSPPAPYLGRLQRFAWPRLTENQGVLFHATILQPELVVTPAGVVAIDSILMRCVGGDLDCTTLASGGGLGTGTAEVLVAVNDPIPDRPGRHLCSLSTNSTNASDWGITFRAETRLDCGDPNESSVIGYFRLAYGGALETLAMDGDSSNPFPGAGGTVFSFSTKGGGFKFAPAIEDDGVVVFLAKTKGLVAETIIYRCDPAICPAVTRPIHVIRPETLVSPGVSVSKFIKAGVTDVGDISFHARVSELGVGKGLGIYLYRSATGTYERIAVKKDSVPGAPESQYRRVFLPNISPQGRIAFKAKIRTPGSKNTLQIMLVD